jgi:hypothetical protein
LGIALDVIGKGFNTTTSKPEEALQVYDIVFAKARCALEAMAVGSAVLLCDFAGLGTMVNCANFSELRKLNFGAGTLLRPLDPRLIAAEINQYDAQEAKRVSERARGEANLAGAVVEWLELYNEVIAGNAVLTKRCDESRRAAELAALANYLVQWGYDARVELETQRLKKLANWPLLGRCVNWAMERERIRMLSVRDIPRRP